MSNYIELVKEGKSIILKIKELETSLDSYQQRIAAMAAEACTIRHGGISTSFYTLKDFASDIDVNYKTLQNWVRIFRNVIQKLPIEKQAPTSNNWKKSVRTLEVLNQKNRSLNSINNNKGSVRPYLEDNDKEVEAIFDSFENPKEFQHKFLNIIASQKYLKHCLTVLDKKTVSDPQWIDLMSLLDSNSDTINDYLTSKAKAS